MNNNITLFLLPAFLCLASCSSHGPEEHKPATDSLTTAGEFNDTAAHTVNDLVRFKFDFAVGNVPSPAELINDMSTYNFIYNSAYLSNTEKARSYKTDFTKAVNLGIYYLDMAYAVSNNRGVEVVKYLKTSMIEVEALGMKSAFDQFVGKRTETNINNKDSLLRIIDDMYVKGDSYLRTNQRVETATYIFAGSWVEALYLIGKTGENEADAIQRARLHKHLWEQRFYLKNLTDILDEFTKTSPQAKDLHADLSDILKEINAIADLKDMKAKHFKSIADKVIALRLKLTS